MFYEFLQMYLPIVIYVLLIILIIVAIVIGCKLVTFLDELNHISKSVSEKIDSLNNIFKAIDFATDKVNDLTTRMVDAIVTKVSKLVRKKPRKKKEEDTNE